MAALRRRVRALSSSRLRRQPSDDAPLPGLRDAGAAGIASSGLMLLAADEHMRLRDASAQACRVLGYSRAELLSLRVPDLLRDDGDVASRFAAYLAAGEQRGRAMLKRKDGTTLEAGYHALVMEIGGESYYVCIVVPDLAASVSARDAVSNTAAF